MKEIRVQVAVMVNARVRVTLPEPGDVDKSDIVTVGGYAGTLRIHPVSTLLDVGVGDLTEHEQGVIARLAVNQAMEEAGAQVASEAREYIGDRIGEGPPEAIGFPTPKVGDA